MNSYSSNHTVELQTHRNDKYTLEVFSFFLLYVIALKKSFNGWTVLHKFTCILKTIESQLVHVHVLLFLIHISVIYFVLMFSFRTTSF